MRRGFWIFITAMLMICAPLAAQAQTRWVMAAHNGLTGGTTGTLDNIDVCNADGNGYDVQDGDACLVWRTVAAGGEWSFYVFDDDSAAAS
jgi:hypothetical protein